MAAEPSPPVDTTAPSDPAVDSQVDVDADVEMASDANDEPAVDASDDIAVAEDSAPAPTLSEIAGSDDDSEAEGEDSDVALGLVGSGGLREDDDDDEAISLPHRDLEAILEEPEEPVAGKEVEKEIVGAPASHGDLPPLDEAAVPTTNESADLPDSHLLSGTPTPSTSAPPSTQSLNPSPSGSAILSAIASSQSSLGKRSPPIPGQLTMPPGLQGMSQKEVRKRFNGYKIIAVLALNVDLIK